MRLIVSSEMRNRLRAMFVGVWMRTSPACSLPLARFATARRKDDEEEPMDKQAIIDVSKKRREGEVSPDSWTGNKSFQSNFFSGRRLHAP